MSGERVPSKISFKGTWSSIRRRCCQVTSVSIFSIGGAIVHSSSPRETRSPAACNRRAIEKIGPNGFVGRDQRGRDGFGLRHRRCRWVLYHSPRGSTIQVHVSLQVLRRG